MLGRHKHHHATRDFDGITDDRAQGIPWYFTALFYGLLLWGLAYMGYFLLSGWSQEGEFEARMAAYEAEHRSAPAAAVAAQPPAREELLAKGAALYAKRCRACHGAEGRGGVGPDLTRAQYRYGRDTEAVEASIRDGRPAGMPAFGNKLSDAEIRALAAHVLHLE